MKKNLDKSTAPVPVDEKGCAISVGGQAVMEGVMMQGPEKVALAVRQPDGAIALRVKPRKQLSDKYKFLGWPIIRGMVNLVVMLYMGMKTLTESVEMSGELVEEPSKLEKKIAKALRMKPDDVMMIVAVILALALAIGMFFVLPTLVESAIKPFVSSRFLINAIGGVLRITIFMVYIVLVSRMKEIRRVFQYHGAEHKAVHCFEHGKKLTVENAQQFTTLHPRCGTSFLFIVMAISILVFMLLGTDSANVLTRVGSRLLLLPLVAGLSYEILRWLGKAGDGPVVTALKWPGLMLQKLTTAPPEDSMVEVALVSLKTALGMITPEEFEAQQHRAKAQADQGQAESQTAAASQVEPEAAIQTAEQPDGVAKGA